MLRKNQLLQVYGYLINSEIKQRKDMNTDSKKYIITNWFPGLSLLLIQLIIMFFFCGLRVCQWVWVRCMTCISSVLIAACSAPDRLLTSIPMGDNDTNTCKQRSDLMPAWEEEGLGH